MKRSTAVSRLPEDIIILILSMLPVKSIIRFKCVCKLWLKRFQNPNFIKTHLNHAVENNNYNLFIRASYKEPPSCYRLDFDAASASYLSEKAVRIDLQSTVHRELLTSSTCVSSCNGILCFAHDNVSEDSITICLWNPSTQEYKEIVKPLFNNSCVEIYGFCYDCKIDDYKLIIVVTDHSDLSEIHVYTLGSNSWKKIGKTHYVHSFTRHSGYMLNGAMHWLARKGMVTDNQPEESMVITSFDIAEETTKEIQVPSCKLIDATVGVLGKDLYLSVCVSDIFELWVMKDYGVVDSWTKLLSIPEEMGKFRIWRALPYFTKNREILFTCFRYERKPYKDAIISYDLRNERSTVLNFNGMPGTFSAQTFIGSLVSLNSCA